MFVPQHVNDAISFRSGPSIAGGKTFDGLGVIAGTLHGRIENMFGPVIITAAHLAFAGVRTHSNNTTEMTAMIEALSFLVLHGTVDRDANSCI